MFVTNVMRENIKLLNCNCKARNCPHFTLLFWGTFKLKKTDLQKQGYDLSKCNGDPVYYWNAANKAYEPLTEQMQKDIDTGAYNRF